jgi:protein-ribulosamine 3-kinase
MIQNVPVQIQHGIQKLLGGEYLHSVTLEKFSFISGGCINKGGRLKTSAGDFFIKWNDALKFPDMFAAEANGLNRLAAVQAIDIPKVIGHGEAIPYQFILMEFIESTFRTKQYWGQLGEQLASLHKKTNMSFGLDHQNYIGSLKQFNNPKNSWIQFFIEHRLNAQLKLAVDNGVADNVSRKKFEQLYILLPTLLPEEQPALLHGDLWGGNLITNKTGSPCLIDPAVYYGNREVEIAFTKLFGGFDKSFYGIYNEVFPLQLNFKEREDIYNLYPLLVHANLFGGHYMNQVNHILDSILRH